MNSLDKTNLLTLQQSSSLRPTDSQKPKVKKLKDDNIYIPGNNYSKNEGRYHWS